MVKDSALITRRRFIQRYGYGGMATGAFLAVPSAFRSSPRIRRVLVMADIHIGRAADGLDGAEWLARGLTDLERNVKPIHYGITLGDITHNGDRESLVEYLTLRDKSHIPRWLELAGNHEYHRQGIGHFRDLVRSTAPHAYIDGNIAWFFVSDENRHGSGSVSDKSYEWLRRTIHKHADKIVILCSHQPPPNTVRNSDRDVFCLHPKEKIAAILEDAPITLSLCGHEHHRPYSDENMVRDGQMTVINAASMTHAYNTKTSHSLVLELVEGAKEMVVRHRNHDAGRFQKQFEVRIPLATRIRLA